MSTDSREKPFRPAWWLPGGHLQTIVPHVFRLRRAPMLRRQQITLPDGDFLVLDWGPDPGGPIVVLLHGLGGNSRSAYARVLMRALHAHGFWACTMHFRGAGGEPNRKLRSYHMGECGDPIFVLSELRRRYSRRKLAAVGVSLGGSALLHSLAVNSENPIVDCAVAVSVPFRLHHAEERLNRGWSRLYQRHILRQLRRDWQRKCRVLARPDLATDLHEMRSFRQFDARITAPLHGYVDVDDYYDRASSYQLLRDIRIPILLIHALNDPFMRPDSLPQPDELSPCVTLEVHRAGGHVGFLESSGRSYLERRVPGYLLEQLRNK
jgi:uncharacterized protein